MVSRFLILDFWNVTVIVPWMAGSNLYPFSFPRWVLLSTNMRVLHHLATYSCSYINSLLGAAQYSHSYVL